MLCARFVLVLTVGGYVPRSWVSLMTMFKKEALIIRFFIAAMFFFAAMFIDASDGLAASQPIFRTNAKRHGRMDMNGVSWSILGSLMLLGLAGANITYAQQSEMTFFITSAGSGRGGDLGGLAGADKHCQMLAQAAGAGGKTWHAYPSTPGG